MKHLLIIGAILVLFGCAKQKEMELKELIGNIEMQVKPLNKEAALAYWNATITGDPAEFDKYSEINMKIVKIYSDNEIFAKLKSFKESGKIKDSVLIRELEVVFNKFLGNQTDTSLLNQVIQRSSALEQKYATFRANYKGAEISDNQVENILQTSVNNNDLKEAWMAHKKIGNFVAQDIIEIVKLRNMVAASLGFDNFHTMSLELLGQNPDEVSELFDELDELTKDAFAQLKEEMDEKFSLRYKTPKAELMPWHYQGRFFQESPQLYPVDLDKYYAGKNLEELTAGYFTGIGLDVNGIMSNSDLYEKPGKNQHAYCIDIDTEGDVRVLCNIKDNEQWMGTMLHEFGHAVYAQGYGIPANPYFLREAAHPFTTEAVAMLFGRLSRNPEWMSKMLDIPESETERIAEDCFKSLRLQQLVFSRWSQVMYRFEKEMYADPDQNLNNLWWSLVSQYQLLNKPEGRDEPDWATKIHIALYPCYYHNYQLGELLASQFHYYIVNNITKSGNLKSDSYIGSKETGKWISEKVFESGMKLKWNDMIEYATGEKLTAKYYANQFVD